MSRPTDFRQSLRSVLATSSRDWGIDRADAWIYGIVWGWGPDPDEIVGEDDDAMVEMAERHGWDEGEVARLRMLHAQFAALAGTTREEWRINGPEGPSYAIDQGHPEAEKWTRRAVASQPGRYVERRTVTDYPTVTTVWEQA